MPVWTFGRPAEFQSTLSVRRATRGMTDNDVTRRISIHALRKESDPPTMPEQRSKHISIHALRKESDTSS